MQNSRPWTPNTEKQSFLFFYFFYVDLLSERAVPYCRLYILYIITQAPLPVTNLLGLPDAPRKAHPECSLPPRPNLSPVVYGHTLLLCWWWLAYLVYVLDSVLNLGVTFAVPKSLKKGSVLGLVVLELLCWCCLSSIECSWVNLDAELRVEFIDWGVTIGNCRMVLLIESAGSVDKFNYCFHVVSIFH
jgi:hypothetical protein